MRQLSRPILATLMAGCIAMCPWPVWAQSLPTWDQQIEQLKGLGDDLANESGRNDSDVRRQDMNRYVMGAIADGFLHYVNADPARPTWTPEWNSALNYAGPNPDYAYKHALVDPRGVYRISGYRGSALFVEITQQAEPFVTAGWVNGLEAKKPSPGTFDLDSLHFGKGGYFSVVLSAERPVGYSGDWWHLDPATHSLLMRQTAYDWRNEVDPRIAIARLDPAEPLTPEEISARLAQLRPFALGLVGMGVRLARYYREHHGINTIKTSAQMKSTNPFPGQIYLDGAFEIGDDEALILETRVPAKCRYWQILLADDRFATINWLEHQSSINGHQARIDRDGKFRAVISARDPGVPNWLDTAREPWGIMQMRWNRCNEAPEPTVIRVPFAKVRDHLPPETGVVTPEQRRQALADRREAAQFRRLW